MFPLTPTRLVHLAAGGPEDSRRSGSLEISYLFFIIVLMVCKDSNPQLGRYRNSNAQITSRVFEVLPKLAVSFVVLPALASAHIVQWSFFVCFSNQDLSFFKWRRFVAYRSRFSAINYRYFHVNNTEL